MKKHLIAIIFITLNCVSFSILAQEAEIREIQTTPQGFDPQHYFLQIIETTYLENPTILAERDRLKSIDEDYAIAFSEFRPTLLANGGHTIVNQKFKTPTPPNDRHTLHQDHFGATLSQPVFDGFKTIYGLKRANHRIMAGRERLLSVENNALLDAINAYYTFILNKRIVRLNQHNVKVLSEQKKATEARFKVGQLTKTDLSQSASRLARGEANLIKAKGDLEISKSNFQRITGQPPDEHASFVNFLLPMPPSYDEALSYALDNSPLLLESRYTSEAAKSKIGVDRGDLLPKISIDGSSTKNFNPSRSISTSDSSQIAANITIPLYQAGAPSARVRQSKQLAKQSENDVEVARRNITDLISQAWANLETARSTIKASRGEANATEIALKGVRAESRVGKRTILDNLDAEQENLDAQTRLITAQHDEIIAKYNLHRYMGNINEILKISATRQYDPNVYSKRKKHSLGGTSIN